MKKLILLMATMALSGAAIAGPAWTYVDGGIVFADSEGRDTSTGAALTGSFGLDLFHFNLGAVALDDACSDCGPTGDSDDYASFRVGAGIHPAITDTTDLVVELGFTAGEYDDGEAEPDGVDLTFGVRSMIADNFELNAAAVIFYGTSDLCSNDGAPPGCDDDLQDVGIRIGGQYFFTDRLSMNATATQGLSAATGTEGGDSMQIGARFSF
jgi:hypothetical protein